MTTILSLLLLAAIASVATLTALLQRYGLAGTLYLASALLHAAGDAVRAADTRYREAWPEYRQQAERGTGIL